MAQARWVADAIDVLEERGCQLEITDKNHYKIYIYFQGRKLPKPWIAPKTPSDYRSQKNSIAGLKRLLREEGIEPPQFRYRGDQPDTDWARLWDIIDEAEASDPSQE